jgi:hypothetical protein
MILLPDQTRLSGRGRSATTVDTLRRLAPLAAGPD